MQIKLHELIVRNFRSIEEFRIELGGSSCSIFGRNGIGKSTLADAYFWLTTDMNSASSSPTRFSVLKLGQEDTPEPAEVEGTFSVGSKIIHLKKRYRQKKSGSFTTEYFFEGANLSRKRYLEATEKYFTPGKARVLSDVHHFCGRMLPEDRREILMQLSTNLSDIELCEAHPQLREVIDLLGDLTVKETQKALKDLIKGFDEQKKYQRQAIKDLKATCPDISGSREELTQNINLMNERIRAKEAEAVEIGSGLAIQKLKIELTALSAKVNGAKRDRLDELEEKVKDARNGVNLQDRKIDFHRDEIESIQERKDRLKLEWLRINKQPFEKSMVCFACGTELSEEQIKLQEEEFKNKKAEELKPLNEAGRMMAAKIVELNEKIGTAEMVKASCAETIEEINQRIKHVEAEIDAELGTEINRIKEIGEEMDSMAETIYPALAAVEGALDDLKTERERLDSELLKFTHIEKINNRIEQKEAAIKKAEIQKEEYARQMDLIEQFGIIKGREIEKRINDHFVLTEWKLFEMTQGDTLKKICEPMRNGIPYTHDLNTGSKIQVGLDCVYTLAAFYKTYLPIWIDNAESVTHWEADQDNQIIKLIASRDDNELRMEVND